MATSLYKVTLPGGLVYFGIAIDIPARWREHRTRSTSRAIRRAVADHGADALAFEVIATGTAARMRTLELAAIRAAGVRAVNIECGHGRGRFR